MHYNMEDNIKSEDENFKYQKVGLKNLSDKLLSRARTELNETDENVKIGLQAMKDGIEKEQLYLERDEMLLKFLRVKKYNFKASLESYKHYLNAVSICLKQLTIPDFETFKYAMEKNIGCVLPYKDKEDRSIMLYRLGCYHHEGLTREDGICILLSLAFCLITDPATQVSGVCVIIDAKDMMFSDAPFIISYIRWLIPMLKGFPGRLRRLDFVNQPTIFGSLLYFVRPVFPSKIRDRIMMHGCDRDSLLKIYPASIIPTEYGGTLGPLNNDHWLDRMETYYDLFQTDTRKIFENTMAK